MVRVRAALCALLVLWGPAAAADDGLTALSASLRAIRATHGVNDDRDAGPELTPAKAQLRAWIESRIGVLQHPYEDAKPLAAELNKALGDAGLICPHTPDACIDATGSDDARGYVGEVSLSYAGRYLMVETDIGVRCGYDTSVYLYARGNGGGAGWRRVLTSEQDDYRATVYRPQNVTGVQVSRDETAPLVLTLGISPACQSNWQLIYTRLWRMGIAAPLVDAQDTIFLDDDMGSATLSDSDAIVRYRGASFDSDSLVRTHVMHYVVDGAGTARRVAPLAFNPRDFVDEWLNRPWQESADWIAPGADGAALHRLHTAWHKGQDFVLGDFDGAATRCRANPALWQVAANIGDGDDKVPDTYFIVRWTAPYRFALVAARARKMPRCDVADPLLDNPN
jgi:hypothetical protein